MRTSKPASSGQPAATKRVAHLMMRALAALMAMLFLVPASAGTRPRSPSKCAFPADGNISYGGDLPECFRSPDQRFLVIVHGGVVRLRTAQHTYDAGRIDGGRVLWAPDARGFVLADNAGSGETERFAYVDMTPGRPRLRINLRKAGEARFARAYHCRGRDYYANTLTDGWTADGKVRMVVQNGVHSQGCRIDDENMIGVIGDPVTGRIVAQLSPGDVRRQWCSARNRAEYGYCYVEAEFRKAHPKQR